MHDHNHKCLHEEKIPEIDRKLDRVLWVLQDPDVGHCGRLKSLEKKQEGQAKFVAFFGLVMTGIGAVVGYFANMFKG